MKIFVYSIRDSKAELFGRPFYMQNAVMAMRTFSDEVNKPSSYDRPNDLNSHAEDFVLYELGSYDDETGRFDQYDNPKSLVSALNVLKVHPIDDPRVEGRDELGRKYVSS